MTTEADLKVITLSGIDGKTTGAIKIDTTAAGLRFVPLYINIEATTVSGLILASSLSVGTNGSSYNDMLAITAMTGLASSNIMTMLSVTALSSSLPAATDIYVKITTGATATTYTLRVSVIGFYY